MKDKLKHDLKLIFEAPQPQRKMEFIMKVKEPALSMGEFLWIQVRYIRKLNWAMAVILFIISIYVSRNINQERLWLLSASIPLMVLCTVSEGNRSAIHGMEELELTSRFSLKTILIARIGILGIGNLITLGVIYIIFIIRDVNGILNTGIHIMVPYLLTSFLDLYFVRKRHGKESSMLCYGATLFVSGGYFIIGNMPKDLLGVMNLWGMAVVVLVLAILVVREGYLWIKQGEEFTWN